VRAIGNNFAAGASNLHTVRFGTNARGERAIRYIRERAFMSSNVQSIDLTGIQVIEGGAFARNRSLLNLRLPTSLRYIGERAFSWMDISSVTIPRNVLHIGRWAFADNRNLTQVTFLNNDAGVLANYCSTAFDNSNFPQIRVPYNVVDNYRNQFTGHRIYDSRFLYGNLGNGQASIIGISSGLQGAIVIPTQAGWNTVTEIGQSAFANQNSITEITIPNSIASIGSSAFENMLSLESITVAAGNAHYLSQSGVLYRMGVPFQFVQVPTRVSGSIIIPNGVSVIPANAFANRNFIRNITIPSTVTTIGVRAFINTPNLNTVTLPSSVRNVEWDAFGDWVVTDRITLDGRRLDATSRWGNNWRGQASLSHIYRGMYIRDRVVVSFSDSNESHINIPNCVVGIEANVFSNSIILRLITISGTIEWIGENAFGLWTIDREIVVRDRYEEPSGWGVNWSGDARVSWNWTYGFLEILDGVVINFWGHSSAQAEVRLPQSVTVVNDWAFSPTSPNARNNVEVVFIHSGIEYIGQNAFANWHDWHIIVLEGREEIPHYWGYNWSGNAKVVFSCGCMFGHAFVTEGSFAANEIRYSRLSIENNPHSGNYEIDIFMTFWNADSFISFLRYGNTTHRLAVFLGEISRNEIVGEMSWCTFNARAYRNILIEPIASGITTWQQFFDFEFLNLTYGQKYTVFLFAYASPAPNPLRFFSNGATFIMKHKL